MYGDFVKYYDFAVHSFLWVSCTAGRGKPLPYVLIQPCFFDFILAAAHGLLVQIRYWRMASGHFSRSELMEMTNSIFSRSA